MPGTLTGTADELVSAYSDLQEIRSLMSATGASGAGLSRDTVRGAGGIDALKSGVADYLDAYFTDAEKAAAATQRMREEFNRIGVAMPASIAAFRQLPTAIGNNDASEAGQKLYGQLMSLAGGFAEVQETAKKGLLVSVGDFLFFDTANLRLGVGTNGPTEMLHVKGNGARALVESHQNNTSAEVNLITRDAGGVSQYAAMYIAGDGHWRVWCGGERLIVKKTGVVQLLAYPAGTLVTDGAGNITASSDERMKDIVGPFTKGLDEVLRIFPIDYYWNAESGLDTTRKYSGLSAQTCTR
jgi:hypothetical protein